MKTKLPCRDRQGSGAILIALQADAIFKAILRIKDAFFEAILRMDFP